MTRRERLEWKMEKRREWAESRQAKANMEWNKGDLREEKSGIPLGQPILVGHHSEGKHRRAIERANRAMQRAHENQEKAKEHASKAANLESTLDRTIFSDDENAVEALKARIAKHEAERARNNQINSIIRKAPKGIKTPEKIAALIALGLPESISEEFFEKDCFGCVGISAYVNRNLAGRIKADEIRLKRVQAQQANKVAAQESVNGVTVKTNVYGRYFVTFAEKPDRVIINELKAAGYYWNSGSWIGEKDKLPKCVSDLLGAV